MNRNRWHDPANYSPDLPADTLVDPQKARQYLHGKGYDLDPSFRFKEPDIEGGYAFNKCWALCEEVLEKARNVELDGMVVPIVGLAMEGLEAMQHSHVITIDPAQIDAIPDFEHVQDVVDYGRHAKLPFDNIFIDIETPVRKYVHNERVEVQGAFIRRQDFGIEIMPVCSAVRDDPFEARYMPTGHILIADSDNELSSPHYTVIKDEPGMLAPRLVTSLTYASLYIKNHNPGDDITFDPHYADEYPADPCHLVQTILPKATDTTHLMGAAQMVAGLHTALKVLFFLDTPNIEIAPAQMSRQVRRAAERRGATISSTVWVKHNQRRYEAKVHDDPTRMEYSHQFEVRGHWKYYPEGTRTADARPDLLSYVPGRGMCRKIWCPSFVKGDPDKPLVIKTRRMRKEES